MKVSDYVFTFLKSKGVSEVFMLPGGGAMHLVDSLGGSGIDYICFEHEQGAAIAAEAYGQHTNTPGVLLTTSGPGATNAITGVTAGWIDSTPMFIISGQAKRSDLIGETGVRQIGSQEVQIVPMVTPITKYAVQIMDPLEIRYHLEKAWYLATNGRPGPVWLSIPLDVQCAEIDTVKTEEMVYIPEEPAGASEEEIEKAAKAAFNLLTSSKRPLILLGNGIKLSGATEKAYELIEKMDLPAQTTWKTIDMLAEDDPHYVGHPGGMGDRGANLILQQCDLLLSVGSRLDTSLTAFNDANFAKNAKKIIVDIDKNELLRMKMDKEIQISCDAGLFLEMLLKEIGERKFNNSEWVKECKNLREKYPVVTEEYREKTEYVSAFYFTEKLCELLQNDDVIVPESSGGAGEITYQAFKIKKGQKMKNAAGLGSMGFGLPYAIGSCVANDKRRTILINGDGAFQLNIQELETLHRLKLPVKMFIWNNGGYVSIRNMQGGNFGRFVACDPESGYSTPDISKVANAYGFKTCKIMNNAEVDTLLPKLLQDDTPVLCEVIVDPKEGAKPRCRARRNEQGMIVSDPLEDMWPYISDEMTPPLSKA
ncbi:MAG: thiamine pyrophosphate-binding protein [Lachnospiraceae bacterium]|nr:thiamine pyrophosphate-binding protein [Lachnospiraceae bacterium]